VKIHNCEQRTPEWWALRIGIPTASEFKKLVTSKGEPSKSADDYALRLAGEIHANQAELDAWPGNTYTDRGRGLEERAVERYEFINDVQVERVGFITDDDMRMGYSPDGLVNPEGLIEVKCLKAENHIKVLLYHLRYDRCPSTYVMQPQGGLMICEREWCDLIFYHPHLPFLTIRQLPETYLHDALRRQIEHVEEYRDLVVNTLAEIRLGGEVDPLPTAITTPATLKEIHEQPPVF